MFTARVPGLGLVEWNRAQVDDYADELARTHRPDRLSIQWRRRGILRWPVLVENVCKHCADQWPCPSAWWADRYQDGRTRALSTH